MIGACIGDIVGSIFEWDNHYKKVFALFTKKSHFTDDTVCSIALGDALLNDKDVTRTLQTWCQKYPNAGYGGFFRKWVKDPLPKPYNSFGNGSAMRCSSAGWLGSTLDECLALSDKITEVTHNHPEGMKGARATVHAIWMARQKKSAAEIRKEIVAVYGYNLNRTVDEIRPHPFNETCQKTVPEALTCALEATSYEDAIRNAISIGGDSDTNAAIAGGVAEPLFGIPEDIIKQGRTFLTAEMLVVLDAFNERVK